MENITHMMGGDATSQSAQAGRHVAFRNVLAVSCCSQQVDKACAALICLRRLQVRGVRYAKSLHSTQGPCNICMRSSLSHPNSYAGACILEGL